MTTKQKPATPAKRKQEEKKRTAPPTARIDTELRRYCEKQMAATEAERKKAVAEGRAYELVKYDSKTGRCVWRKVKA